MIAERKIGGDLCAESAAITKEYVAKFIAFDKRLR
jgi:hypothetical protein